MIIEFAFGSPLIVLLMGIAFLSGIGITTVGPGGIFVTIALYSLTPISHGKVAGTLWRDEKRRGRDDGAYT